MHCEKCHGSASALPTTGREGCFARSQPLASSRIASQANPKICGSAVIICGPAQLAADWHLPVIGPDVSKPGDTIKSLRKEAERFRKSPLATGSVFPLHFGPEQRR